MKLTDSDRLAFSRAMRTFGSMGGNARAKRLSKARRADIARQGGIASGKARAKVSQGDKKAL